MTFVYVAHRLIIIEVELDQCSVIDVSIEFFAIQMAPDILFGELRIKTRVHKIRL